MIAALNKPQLSNKVRISIFTGGSLLLILLFWFAVYLPSVAELNRLRTQSQTTMSTLGTLEDVQKQYTGVLTEHQAMFARATEVFSQFPREDDLPAIMSAVDNIARSNGAKTQLVDYAQVQWEKGLGRIQITALFTGNFSSLAATVTNLRNVLPSAQLEQLRITAQNTPSVAPVSGATQAANTGVTTPVVSALRNALGIPSLTTTEQSQTDKENTVNPLQIDHLEAHVVMTLWLIGGGQAASNQQTAGIPTSTEATNQFGNSTSNTDTQINTATDPYTELLDGGGIWFARPIVKPKLPAGDPFRPSARAQHLVELAQLVEEYKDIRVTGMAQTGTRYVATVEFQGREQRVKVGDSVGDAKVTAISYKGVTLSIAGRSILIAFGGEER